ncbi:MAG TPA: hypothetical protein VNA04_07685 [Thermoanaerobaculia bacterium]|nr:hypothetical protein [Thermoanaerobaculia bacterium]
MTRTTRRKFAKTMTAATVALPVVAGSLLAQTAAPAPPPPTTAPAQEPAPEAKRPSPLAVALAGVVSAQSGQFLDEEEMQRVFDDFKSSVPFLERFRDYELKNGDEPDFTFHSLVERW